jgi:uracil-DNA glycosylase
MGFCYPGTGRSGDLPPRIELTLVIGQCAMEWHLPGRSTVNLTETVTAWRDHWPAVLPLPHPSPRNNLWLKANPWFERYLVPVLQERFRAILMQPRTDDAMWRQRF